MSLLHLLCSVQSGGSVRILLSAVRTGITPTTEITRKGVDPKQCFFFDGPPLSFAYVAHLGFLKAFWIGTQRAAVARRRATNLATPLPGSRIGHIRRCA
jgi:hypothetical protein